MKRGKNPSASRKRRSSGNVIVESVFTMLPTFALILAFVDFSLMLFRRSTSPECGARRLPVRGDFPDGGGAGPGRLH